MRLVAVPCTLAVVIAGGCTFTGSGGGGSHGGLGGSAAATGDETVTATTDEGPTPMESGDATAGGDASGDASSATTDPTGVPGDGPSDDDPSDDDPSDDDDTGGSGGEIHLQNAAQGDCNEPLWCFDGITGAPLGGPMWSVECFDSGLTPPYVLERVHFFVAGKGGSAGASTLHVYAWNEGPAATPLYTQPLTAAQVPLGHATIELDVDLALQTSAFCVGLATMSGDAGSIGIGVDQASAIDAVSFVRLGLGGACDIPDFVDVIALEPTPTGNWCIDAWVRP